MVISMVEGRVAVDKQEALQAEYQQEVLQGLPAGILQTFLLRKADDAAAWRIITVWKSMAELQAVRQSPEQPPAMRMFKSAGVDATLTVFEVVHTVSHQAPLGAQI